MSAICIVNFKEHGLDFSELNCLANELVAFALKKGLGVSFNAKDYGYELIREAGMNSYFLLSDSFLYENCEFLEEPLYLLERETERRSYAAFRESYLFMEEMLSLIFRHRVSCVELYLSEDGYESSVSEFSPIQTTAEDFMKCWFQTVYDPERKRFADAFQAVRFQICDEGKES